MVKIICLLTSLLVGCTQIDETFIPPDSDQGRRCVAKCQIRRQKCNQIQQIRYERCKRQAAYDYQRCIDRRERRLDRAYADHVLNCMQEGGHLCKSVESFKSWERDTNSEFKCSEAMCSSSNSSCQSDYRECFRLCGGVIEITRYETDWLGNRTGPDEVNHDG